MKRSTILFEDGIYDQIKAYSQKEGSSLKDMINDLLRFALLNFPKQKHKKSKKFKVPVHDTGPLPGVDIADRGSLYDILEDDSWLSQ